MAAVAVREFCSGALGQTRTVLWEPTKAKGSSEVWSGLTDNYLRVRAQDSRNLGNVITDARLTGLDEGWVAAEVV